MALPRAAVIMNARSGATSAYAGARALRDLAHRRGAEWEVLLARHPRQLKPLARQAIRDGYPVLIAGGGDGTVNAVASVAFEEGAILGALPLGTFNYLARDLGIPLELEPAFDAICDGRVIDMQVAEVNGQIFLNNASIGLYPSVLEVREETYRRWGRSRVAAYASVLLSIMRANFHLDLRLVADGREEIIHTPMLFAARNAHQIESFSLEGGGCVRSDRIAFYIVPPVSRLGLFQMAARMLLRRMQPARDFKLMCANTLQVSTRRRRLSVAYDGERMTSSVPLTFRIHERPLRVLAPAAQASGVPGAAA
ncbi:MAG TPA: diacylglycerol kinase family protein [Clostridia bacterium]|nr:diacylglycerol kinase family protein [Clostridia bacterium]